VSEMESPHATSSVKIVITYLLSSIVSEIWRITGPIFALDTGGGASLQCTRWGEPLNLVLRNLASRN